VSKSFPAGLDVRDAAMVDQRPVDVEQYEAHWAGGGHRPMIAERPTARNSAEPALHQMYAVATQGFIDGSSCWEADPRSMLLDRPCRSPNRAAPGSLVVNHVALAERVPLAFQDDFPH